MAAMDKIPSKFRRKLKPPAIDTTIEVCYDGTSSDATDTPSTASTSRFRLRTPDEQPAEQDQSQDPEQERHRQRQRQRDSKTAVKPPKKSPFRGLKLPRSGKRARASPPAELPASPPHPAVVSQDGASAHSIATTSPEHNNGDTNGPHDPRVPGFLALSAQDIDLKFNELGWEERGRLAQGTRNEKIDDFKWGFYKQTNTLQKGLMDRYANIKPWNHNRVRLQVPENELDYVNASDITLLSPSDSTLPPLRYIAMQGPTVPSISYVWRMVAEQITSPAVIIQLTNMVEGGILKCNQYFPDSEEDSTWSLNEDNAWGDDWKADLTYDSMEVLCDGAIEKRKLLLHVEGEEAPRTVWHFLYKRWPDFGVPVLEDLTSFFELMKLSSEHSASGPRVVHCSAGIGRTGTFMCLEHLIRELESDALETNDLSVNRPDLIYAAVNSLREQRRGMVQSDRQYQFIYQVMRKLWQNKYGSAGDDASSDEPAAKRLEVPDLVLESEPSPDLSSLSDASV